MKVFKSRTFLVASLLIVLSLFYSRDINQLFGENFFWSLFGNYFVIIAIIFIASIFNYLKHRNSAPLEAKKDLIIGFVGVASIFGIIILFLYLLASALVGSGGFF